MVRRPARRLRQQLSLAAYRLRQILGRPQPSRIVHQLVDASANHVVPHPAIRLESVSEPDTGQDLQHFLARQTETSVELGHGTDRATAPFVLTVPADYASLPATWLESLLLAAAAEDLYWTRGGWAAPAEPEGGANPLYAGSGTDSGSSLLSRLPGDADTSPAHTSGAAEVYGSDVPHITGPQALDGLSQLAPIPLPNSAGYQLHDSQRGGGRLIQRPVYDLGRTLSRLPAIDGPPTAMMLLPFLAVGGAENLLFDLLEGLTDRYRLLVVTTEPHRAELGQTVDRCRHLTPHVYTLGDWLPRPALAGALDHLLRRWQVSCLMSWNGTMAFYDLLERLRTSHPRLRLVDQHFNHRGGWIDRLTPRALAHLDASVAVNRPIAETLRHEHQAPAEKIRLIHHGARLPAQRSAAEVASRRQHCRELFGLPRDAVVVGTFIRLHPQKRPFDILALARRLRDRGVWFLLAGGGPLDAAIDRELLRQPLDNLLRLPLQAEVEPLYATVDLCLSTSSFEGLPVFLLDALARSLPVVATAVGDIPLLLEGGGGLLVEKPGDLDALEAALLALLDPVERQRRGALGRATVAEQFGLEPYRQAYEAVLFPGQAAP